MENKENYQYLIYLESQGRLTFEQKKRLQEWLDQSETNRLIRKEIVHSLELLEDYSPSVEVDIEQDFRKLKRTINEPKITASTSIKFFKSRWLKVAATLVLLIGAFYLFKIFNFSESNLLVQTNDKEIKQIIFSDGSKVWINENSSIEYPEKFNGISREINLIGEAFFEVEKMPEMPFKVTTLFSTTEVLGTSFNVKALPNDSSTKIIVKSGKVKFSRINGYDNAILSPNQSAILYHQNNTIEKNEIKNLNDIAWQSKILSFRSIELTQVFATLGKHFNVKFDLNGLDATFCKYTMTSQVADLDSILNDLQKIYHLEILKQDQGNYIIKGGKC